MASRSFGNKLPKRSHLVKPGSGLRGEIADLRSDIDEAFESLEGEIVPPPPSGPTLRTIASGTTGHIITGNGIDVGPFALNDGEVLMPVGLRPTFIADSSTFGYQSCDVEVAFFHQSGDAPNEFRLLIFNHSPGDIDLNWTVVGYSS